MSLYELFGEEVERKLATYPSRSLSDMAVAELDPDSFKKKIDIINRVEPKVDYSDFSKFVFFNSAFDYFRISAERILNEYPYDGTHSDLMSFLSESDGYQSYLLASWPKMTGSTAGGFVVQDGFDGHENYHPGTGSFTAESWFYIPVASSTGTNILHRDSGARGSWLVKIDNSNRLLVNFTSGTTAVSCSCSLSDVTHTVNGSPVALYGFFSVVVDSVSDKIYVYVGSTSSLPTLRVTSSYPFSSMNLGSGSLYISGFSGSYTSSSNFSDIRMWNAARSMADIQGDFRSRIFAQDELIGYWRSNERPITQTMRDFSGYKRDATLVSGAFQSSVIMPWDEGDLCLDISDSEVYDLAQTNQQAALTHDRNNSGILTRLVPEKFLLLEDEIQTSVLKNMLYLLGRQFDELKVKIDQFVKIYSSNYTDFDQTPDALLEDALKFWGWDAKGSFLSKEGAQYLFGINVLSEGASDTQKLEESLYTIKNEFWRRIMNNLPYLYKTKGTKESLEALLRVHGLTDRLLKVKEFGYQNESRISDNRIQTEKSVNVLAVTGSSRIFNATSSSLLNTVEMHVKFPSNDSDFARTLTTGSIFRLTSGNGVIARVDFEKSGTTSTTGNLVVKQGTSGSSLTSSFTVYNLPIFNGEWHHISLIRSGSSGTLAVRKRDADSVSTLGSGSGTLSGTSISASHLLVIGSTSSFHSQSAEFFVMEVRAWSRMLSGTELDDHTHNFQSYGTNDGLSTNLLFNYPLNVVVSASSSGTVTVDNTVQLSSMQGSALSFLSGTGSVFSDYVGYNFLAPPDYGWNEKKIRIWDGTDIPRGQQYFENSSVALEFNLVDSLNEDISLMFSTLNNWNNIIGEPANRYRENYQQLDSLRRQYFSRLAGRVNFRIFADFLDFFDRSFIELAKKLIPARATFQGAEFVVESHMLERPKVQQAYRRFSPEFQPEGRMIIFSNTYYNVSSLSLGSEAIPDPVAPTGIEWTGTVDRVPPDGTRFFSILITGGTDQSVTWSVSGPGAVYITLTPDPLENDLVCEVYAAFGAPVPTSTTIRAECNAAPGLYVEHTFLIDNI